MLAIGACIEIGVLKIVQSAAGESVVGSCAVRHVWEGLGDGIEVLKQATQ